ncbi:CARDB domain-containing protein [Natrinema sp. SYSU A 869]|uniref:CARDB domain-containing protein n=1 Tax=Natrinema sp. SYSU A 869 TaxID=2871694 RepID=UPI001CA38F01|nr:CARDB domain-containing protein [Natrinema sp. SYSU A 869]
MNRRKGRAISTSREEGNENNKERTCIAENISRRSFLGSTTLLVGTSTVTARQQEQDDSGEGTELGTLSFDEQLSSKDSHTGTYPADIPRVATNVELENRVTIDPAKQTGNIELGTTVEGEFGDIGAGGGYVSAGRHLFSAEWEAPRDETFTVSSEYAYEGNVFQYRESSRYQNAVNRVGVQGRLVIRDAATGDIIAESQPVVEWDLVIPHLDTLDNEWMISAFEALIDEVIPIVGGQIAEEVTERPDENVHAPGDPNQPKPISGESSASVSFTASQGKTYEIQKLFEGVTLAVSIFGAPSEAELSFSPTVHDLRVAVTEGQEQGPSLEVMISETNAPVNASEFLEVTAQIKNTGEASTRQTIDLIVGHSPEQVDTKTVTLGPGETQTITLGYETYPAKQTTKFPVRVQSEDDTAERSVTVYGTEDESRAEDNRPTGSSFVVDITKTNTPLDAGKFLQVTAVVKNTGPTEATQTIRLIVGHSPEQVDTETVTLGPGSSKTITLGYSTYPAKQTTEFPVRIETEKDADEQSVRVYGTG